MRAAGVAPASAPGCARARLIASSSSSPSRRAPRQTRATTRGNTARAVERGARAVASSFCGIDLGTTNSAVAIVRDGEAMIVPCQGHRTMPSVVTFGPDGAAVAVGRDARKRLRADSRNTAHSVKRFIGRKYKKCKAQAKDVPYRVVSHPETKFAAIAAVNEEGEEYVVTPEEASSHVLRTLLDAAEAELGMPIEKAVITVPAYFEDAQMEATIRAGELAGLKAVRLLKEPVAAALAYGVDVDGDETVFVFDLGGGTFDVSVLEVGGGTVEVLATGGDPHLGGDDFDRILAIWLAGEAKSLGASVDPRGALSVARKAREALSDQEQVEVPMPDGSMRVLTRSLFEKLVVDILRRMRHPVSAAADSAGVDLEAILENSRKKDGASRAAGRPFDQILLVGGATKSPCVRRFVENTLGRKPNVSLVNPDEAVALGAAIHAGSLEGSIENVQTLNSMQASLIRALTAKMKRDDTDGDWDDDTSCVDGDWDESCEEDWGPENLDELLDFEDEGPRSS